MLQLSIDGLQNKYQLKQHLIERDIHITVIQKT